MLICLMLMCVDTFKFLLYIVILNTVHLLLVFLFLYTYLCFLYGLCFDQGLLNSEECCFTLYHQV